MNIWRPIMVVAGLALVPHTAYGAPAAPTDSLGAVASGQTRTDWIGLELSPAAVFLGGSSPAYRSPFGLGAHALATIAAFRWGSLAWTVLELGGGPMFAVGDGGAVDWYVGTQPGLSLPLGGSTSADRLQIGCGLGAGQSRYSPGTETGADVGHAGPLMLSPTIRYFHESARVTVGVGFRSMIALPADQGFVAPLLVVLLATWPR